VRYDREKISTTLKAIRKVQEIKSKREKQFYVRRMTAKKDTRLEQNTREIQGQIHLLESQDITKVQTQVQKNAAARAVRRTVRMQTN